MELEGRPDARALLTAVLHEPPSPQLAAHILEALRARDPRERLRQLVARGYTAMQVYERLPAEIQQSLQSGPTEPVVAERQAIGRVQRALIALAAEGTIRRRRVEYGMFLNTKGTRGMIVDVYRR